MTTDAYKYKTMTECEFISKEFDIFDYNGNVQFTSEDKKFLRSIGIKE